MSATNLISAQPAFYRAKEFLEHHPIAVLMALSLVLKLILFGFGQVVNPDGVLYIAAARQIAAGHLSEALKLYPMPAYPMLLTLVHLVLSDWVAAGRLIGIGALVLATIPLYGITRIIFNRQTAFWAALCFALTPEANDQTLMVLRDPVFLLLALSAVWCALRGLHEKRLGHMALSLLLTGLAFLFRVEAAVFYGAPIIFFALSAILGKNDAFRRFARQTLILWVGVPIVFAIITGLLIGPRLLNQNRLGELAAEAGQIVQLKAFDNYQAIYDFFKTVESQPPFSGFSKSLPAIVRHWMPVIYLIGLLEYFVKQIFPLFLVPLLVAAGRYLRCGDRHIDIEKKFILGIWLFYMLFILYSFIVRDFIQGRFLFTPAVMLYPWVGYGIVLIIKWLQGRRYGYLLQAGLILAIVVAPSVKVVEAVAAKDTGLLAAGRFLSHDPLIENAKVLYSDPRLWLYGNGSDSYLNTITPAMIVARHLETGDVNAIEKIAVDGDYEVIALSINFSKTETVPRFEHYGIDKRFPSKKGVVIIYSRRHQE